MKNQAYLHTISRRGSWHGVCFINRSCREYAMKSRIFRHPDGAMPNLSALAYAVLGWFAGVALIVVAAPFGVICGIALIAHGLAVGASPHRVTMIVSGPRSAGFRVPASRPMPGSGRSISATMPIGWTSSVSTIGRNWLPARGGFGAPCWHWNGPMSPPSKSSCATC
jgi:hypothetical protein